MSLASEIGKGPRKEVSCPDIRPANTSAALRGGVEINDRGTARTCAETLRRIRRSPLRATATVLRDDGMNFYRALGKIVFRVFLHRNIDFESRTDFIQRSRAGECILHGVSTKENLPREIRATPIALPAFSRSDYPYSYSLSITSRERN